MFKLNIKFNSSLDNVGVEVNINDFTTFSMDLFMDTTSALENAAKLLSDANARYSRIKGRVDDLEKFVTSVYETAEFKDSLNFLDGYFCGRMYFKWDGSETDETKKFYIPGRN